MTEIYSNLPPKEKDQLEKTIEKLTTTDYETGYQFAAGDYDAAIGFFVKRGFLNKEVLEVILPNYLNPYESNDLVRLGNNNDGGYVVNKNDINAIVKALNEVSSQFNHAIAKGLETKNTPKVSFAADKSLEAIDRMETLLDIK